MSIQRLCDRCGAIGTENHAAQTTRSVTVPPRDPSTNPVPRDFNLTVELESPVDLCAVCFASVLVEYLLTVNSAIFTLEIQKALCARIAKFAAAALTPTPDPQPDTPPNKDVP